MDEASKLLIKFTVFNFESAKASEKFNSILKSVMSNKEREIYYNGKHSVVSKWLSYEQITEKT